MQLRLSHALPLYLGIYASVMAFLLWLIQSDHFLANADSLALGITLDLTLTLPLLYYLIARKSSLPREGIIPVIVLSYFIATGFLPLEHQGWLSIVEMIIIPLELAIIFFVGRKIHKTIGLLRSSGQYSNVGFLEHAGEMVAREFSQKRVAAILATEVSLFYYAFAGWREEIEMKKGLTGYTSYKKSGYKAVMGIVIILVVVESVAAHLFLAHWSNVLPWLVHFIGAYGLLFVIADYNALRLRPAYIIDKTLYLRLGLRWSAAIPLHEIEHIQQSRKPLEKDSGHLDMTLLGTPNLILTLKAPVLVSGFYGITRRPSKIQIQIDQPADFLQHYEGESRSL